MRTGGLAGLAFLVFVPGFASASDALDMLNRAARAAHTLNYTGLYVYQHGEHVELLKVIQRVDASGEKNKVEVIDGPHRIFLRLNDDVYCHSADGKTVRLEKGTARRFFPAVLPSVPASLLDHYTAQIGEVERVAARECQDVLLAPRDDYRFTHTICIDRRTGLPLKTRTINDMGSPISSSTFTEVNIGDIPDMHLFVPQLAGKHIETADSAVTSANWDVSPPPGYVQVMQSHRPLRGKSQPVTQIVFSDGMGAISLFIEPIPEGQSMEGLSTEGSIGIYAHHLGDTKVTTVGEAPAAALIETGNSVHSK
ncbi:MAG: MucB/RseB C-terminal domain-containing protein [Thiobacillaceae bacterium]